MFVLSNVWAMTSGWEDATVTDVVAITAVEVITTVGIFFAGAMAGSFLGVVVHRLPLRQNLLWPPSRCPACGRLIAMRDNLPVVSWLLLRGRCRRCKTNIPPSYLWVEVSVGLLFLALLYLEIYTGGSNLPLRTPEYYTGALWTIWYPRPDVLSVYGYHCALGFFLTCFVLLAWRGERLPGSLVAAALLVGTIVPLLAPGVQQVPWTGATRENPPHQLVPEGVTDAVIGVGAGAVLGAVVGWVGRARRGRVEGPGPRWPVPPALDLAAILAVAGAWLGWQAVVSMSLLTALAMVISPPRLPPLILAVGAIAVQLAAWRLLTTFAPWWPGPHTSLPLMAGWAILAIVLSLAGRFRALGLASPPVSEPAPSPTAEAAPGEGHPEPAPRG
jgi:leader peptidase (prepilin peptidase) / N-methyltransferase